MKSDDYWKKCLINPEEALGEADKSFWIKIEPLLIELLDELKRKGKIEIVYTPIESRHLVNIVLNRNQIIMNFNVLARNTETTEKAQRFIKKASSFGFEASNIIHLLIEFSAFMVITDFECFKTLILFHLKDVNHRASNFNRTIAKYAPLSWDKLKPLMYSDFRNALAHGTWTIENGCVVLFKDAKLVPFEKLELREFMVRTKQLSVLCNCLVSIIQDKIDANFFA
jgi:hypothetical protein